LNYIDIITICILALGFFRGYSKGLILEITSILAISLGIFGSVKFSNETVELLNKYFPVLSENTNDQIVVIFSFAITFLGIIIVVTLIGKTITKALKLVFLGFYNKILGGIFGVVKLFTILSIIFVLFEDLNSKFNIIEINVLNESFAFEKISVIGFSLLEMMSLNNYSINFFN
tara:strand:+ start:129 stop:650 length:522 start_codon:yes stop_codon:yes gene_type:complete